MKKATFILFVFIITCSCKREFAKFQSTKFESFQQVQQKNPPIVSEEKITVLPIYTADLSGQLPHSSEKDIKILNTVIEENPIPASIITKSKPQHNKIIHKALAQKPIFGERKPSKRKNNSFKLNPSIYSGLIILGIAILLALLSLQSLSLLFGLASILFLYWGFKKFFKKQQRKKLF